MDDFEIRCTNPNGRAATYVQCSAYERFATRDKWETKTILSTTAAQGFYRDENAKDYLEQLVQEMKAKGVVFRNQSIAPVLPRDLSARDSDSGKVIWKLTYEVPGC